MRIILTRLLPRLLPSLLRNTGLQSDPAWAKFVLKWLALSFLLHLIGAFFSTGFFHTDEHFQIVEFVNFKLGKSIAADLPLEFGEKMRPWLLPAFFTGLTRVLATLGISSPFKWALAYRLISAFLGWLCTLGLALCCYRWFPKERWRSLAVKALVLLWFVPALHARHSSENWGGAVFFLGISLLVLNDYPKRDAFRSGLLFGVGLLFGFAFELRYQVGLMIFGALCWLLCFRTILFKQWICLLSGLLIAVGIGTLFDKWGYGEWSFAPWNYLKYNLIDNHVSDSETSPWWDYFRRATTESWPLLGSLTLVSFLAAWSFNTKHLLTWCSLPFFIAHLGIAHKEWRFLFPLAHAGGVFIIQALQGFENRIPFVTRMIGVTGERKHSFLESFAVVLIVWNGIALFFTSIVPATPGIRLYQYLYDLSERSKPTPFTVYAQTDQLINYGGAPLNFYRSPHFHFQLFKEFSQFSQLLRQQNLQQGRQQNLQQSEPLWLFYPYYSLPPEAENLRTQCKVVFNTIPEQLEQLKLRQYFKGRVSNWTLFRCQN